MSCSHAGDDKENILRILRQERMIPILLEARLATVAAGKT